MALFFRSLGDVVEEYKDTLSPIGRASLGIAGQARILLLMDRTKANILYSFKGFAGHLFPLSPSAAAVDSETLVAIRNSIRLRMLLSFHCQSQHPIA